MRWATFWRVTQPTQLVFQIPLFLWYFGGNFWKQFCLRYSLSISGTLRLNQSDFSLFTSGFNFVPCRPWYHLLNWGFDVLEIVEKFCDFSWLYSFSFFDILITIFNRGLIYSSSVVIHDWVWLGPWRPMYCFWLSFSNFVIQTL